MGSELKVIKVVRPKLLKESESEKLVILEAAREEARSLIERLVQIISGGGKAVTVRYVVGDRTTQYIVDCPQDSLARLLGARGATIMSIRKVVAALLGVNGIRAIIEVPYYALGSNDDSP